MKFYSKYGHFWLQKTKMATAKIQTQGFKTAVHKPMGDVADSTTSIIYPAYGQIVREDRVHDGTRILILTHIKKCLLTLVLSSTTLSPSADTHNTALTVFFPLWKDRKVSLNNV